MSHNRKGTLDYSKWDDLQDESSVELEEEELEKEQTVIPMAQTTGTSKMNSITKQGSEKGRYRFEYEGRLIYEWDQNLEEVNLYVEAPPNVTAAHISCQISANHLSLALVGSLQKFLDEPTFSKVIVAESSWFLSDGIIQIILMKASRGLTWESALIGKHGTNVDPFTKENIQKEMMLERFQEENPGFDFRDAKFNGSVPDPRTFMGGVGYN